MNRNFFQTASNSTSLTLVAKVTPTLLTRTRWMRSQRLVRRHKPEGLGLGSLLSILPSQSINFFEITSRPRSSQIATNHWRQPTCPCPGQTLSSSICTRIIATSSKGFTPLPSWTGSRGVWSHGGFREVLFKHSSLFGICFPDHVCCKFEAKQNELVLSRLTVRSFFGNNAFIATLKNVIVHVASQFPASNVEYHSTEYTRAAGAEKAPFSIGGLRTSPWPNSSWCTWTRWWTWQRWQRTGKRTWKRQEKKRKWAGKWWMRSNKGKGIRR